MSTIFADKFKNTSGGNNVKVNQLSGIDTAGSITVQGEGTATTNLQQGLAKVWNKTAANGESIEDSFNIASLTDTATGKQTHTFTNNMVNTAFASQTSVTNNNMDQQWTDSQATTGCRTLAYNGSAYEDIKQSLAIMGDLA